MRLSKIFPQRLLISEVDIASRKTLPSGYHRVYRVPATCAVLYCRFPLNYILIILEWLWRIYWRIQGSIYNWFSSHILYRGEWYGG